MTYCTCLALCLGFLPSDAFSFCACLLYGFCLHTLSMCPGLLNFLYLLSLNQHSHHESFCHICNTLFVSFIDIFCSPLFTPFLCSFIASLLAVYNYTAIDNAFSSVRSFFWQQLLCALTVQVQIHKTEEVCVTQQYCQRCFFP